MFFSVKEPVKIGGKPYIPCVCYVEYPDLKATVDKLVKEGKAEKYEKAVCFANGKIVDNNTTTVKETKVLNAVDKKKKEVKTKESF